MTRFTLHVPLVDNDGNPTPDALTARVEDDILAVAGGFTRTEGIGGWQDSYGRTYREPVALYSVDVEDGIARGWLLATADYVRGALDQEAVYLTEAPITATLVTHETV